MRETGASTLESLVEMPMDAIKVSGSIEAWRPHIIPQPAKKNRSLEVGFRYQGKRILPKVEAWLNPQIAIENPSGLDKRYPAPPANASFIAISLMKKAHRARANMIAGPAKRKD